MKYDKNYQSALVPCGVTTEESKPVDPIDPKKGFELAELYKMLDTDDIEIVRLGDSRLILVIDGQGKLRNKPVNATATQLWWTLQPGTRGADYIVGKALVCHTSKVK